MSEEQRGPQSIREGADDTGPIDEPAEGVLTLVCLTCGQEYYFDGSRPPAGMVCEKCGNGVFRDYFTAEEGDDAARDFADSTDRDLDPDDAEGDTMPGDVIDLNGD
jgi:hypothetical protein